MKPAMLARILTPSSTEPESFASAVPGTADELKIVTGVPAGVTVMLAVATFEVAMPSLFLYVKLSAPTKTAFGVYVNDPFAFSASVPLAGLVTKIAVRGFPVNDVSL